MTDSVKTYKEQELIGESFGMLTILSLGYIQKGKRKRLTATCLCECGKEVTKDRYKVTSGHTTSCGCYAKKYRSEFGSRTALPDGESAANEIYGSYKAGAKNREIGFSLDKEQFLNVVVKPCIYCGDSLTNSRTKSANTGTFYYTGIDRYDNSKGYILENCVPCCKICNRIKRDSEVTLLNSYINKMLSSIEEGIKPDEC